MNIVRVIAALVGAADTLLPRAVLWANGERMQWILPPSFESTAT